MLGSNKIHFQKYLSSYIRFFFLIFKIRNICISFSTLPMNLFLVT